MPPRLFLTFLPPASFYANPVRSFLQYLQKHPKFPIINLPDNLYTASETLTEEYQPLTPLLQLQDGTTHPIAIKIIPTSDNDTALILDLGGIDIARKLLGAESSKDSIAWLKDVLITGARMTDASSAIAELSTAPDRTCFLRESEEFLYLETLPIMLRTTALISDELSDAIALAWQIERADDGGQLIIPKPLPSANF
jgi:hypothetical protein